MKLSRILRRKYYVFADQICKQILDIGSEVSGMIRLTRENCDFIVKIPMQGKINSLNASVSAGIVIYEAVRNRKLLQK